MNRFNDIRNWAKDKNLQAQDPHRQMVKLQEEVGELAKAILKKDTPQVIDGLGDSIVVLTILALQLDLDIEECIEFAWNEIKDRKGQTVDGVFVKNE